ncbi:MAG: extracellular solute-binding protein [Leptolyngbyaceae cyanobacterium MO_188.B28]|nr:extracellular solute-binding protein [Leptolyngbyaceae cyanobacterium MO_188.B28]
MRKGWLGAVLLGSVTAIVLIGLRFFVFTSEPSDQKSVTIRLSGWGGSPTEAALLQEVLQDFEALHPHIKVKHEVIAEQYMDVIKTRLIGEAAPDVFYLDVSVAPFLIRKDVLEPLNSYITSDFNLADFEPSLLNPFIYQGQIYGLPKDYSTLVLFYNKHAFAAASLTEPPQTWEELSHYAQL